MAEVAPAIISFLIDYKPSDMYMHAHPDAVLMQSSWLMHHRMPT